MELWIRSQDKECLTIINHLYTNDNCEIKQQDDLVLATYKTKERALEVLDEIHQRLIDIQCLEIIKETTAGMKKRGVDCVYIMPQE